MKRQKLRKIVRKYQLNFWHCIKEIEPQAKSGFLIKTQATLCL